MSKVLKKSLFLFLGLWSLLETQKIECSKLIDTKKLLLMTTGGVIGAVGLHYFYNRECNADRIEQVNRLWNKLGNSILKAEKTDELIKYFVDHKDYYFAVMHSHSGINDRYNSYLKPWDWTADMHNAYEKISFLYTIFYITACVGKEEFLISYFMSVFHDCKYPLITTINYLDLVIACLINNKYSLALDASIRRDLLKVAYCVNHIIYSSVFYKQELRDCSFELIHNYFEKQSIQPDNNDTFKDTAITAITEGTILYRMYRELNNVKLKEL